MQLQYHLYLLKNLRTCCFSHFKWPWIVDYFELLDSQIFNGSCSCNCFNPPKSFFVLVYVYLMMHVYFRKGFLDNFTIRTIIRCLRKSSPSLLSIQEKFQNLLKQSKLITCLISVARWHYLSRLICFWWNKTKIEILSCSN